MASAQQARPRRERTDLDVEAGQLLRAARMRAKLSPKEAAERADYSEDMIYRIERGDSWPPYGGLVRLAAAYGLVGPGDFFANGGVSPETEILAPVASAMTGLDQDQQAELSRHLASQVRMMSVFMRTHAPARDQPGRETRPTIPPDNVTKMPERTLPRWSPEFPINPEDFNENGDTDYPRELHAVEMEDFEGVAGVTGFENDDMGTQVLNSKEVRDSNVRIVKVRGNSMSPTFEEGWKIAVDVTKQDPKSIPEDEAVLVYRKDEGMMIGRYHRDGKRVLLDKDNDAFKAVELLPGDRIVGVVSHVAWMPVRKGKRKRRAS